MIIMAFFSLLGAILSGVYANFPFILGMRFITGLGVGLSSVVCPLYVSEMSPVEQRGFFATLFQLFITVGVLLAYIVGFLVDKYEQDINYQWRIMFILGAFPGLVVFLLAFTLMQESPFWKNKYERINEEPEIHDEESEPILVERSGWKVKKKNTKHKNIYFPQIPQNIFSLGTVFFQKN